MNDTIILFEVGGKDDFYTSFDKSCTFEREGYEWVYKRDGEFVDKDQYRYDLAERHNFKLKGIAEQREDVLKFRV